MRENGSTIREMAMGSRSGLMNLVMKATGQMTKQMDLGNYIMLMETFTKETGETTKLMAQGPTPMLTGQSIQESGRMINSITLGLKLGLIMQYTRASITRERKMVGESSTLLMAQCIRESSK
jgi:hypothetical protein